jgi:hypothetical protein
MIDRGVGFDKLGQLPGPASPHTCRAAAGASHSDLGLKPRLGESNGNSSMTRKKGGPLSARPCPNFQSAIILRGLGGLLGAELGEGQFAMFGSNPTVNPGP